MIKMCLNAVVMKLQNYYRKLEFIFQLKFFSQLRFIYVFLIIVD